MSTPKGQENHLDSRQVRLGEHDLSRDDEGAFPEDFDIEEKLIHSGYHPRFYHNDIGLLKVTTPLTTQF